MRIALLALLVLLTISTALLAADPKPTPPPGQWVTISDTALKEAEAIKKPDWPGGACGTVVDVKTGDVYIVIPGHGLWRSSDHGKTFARADDNHIGGRCETSFSINPDPAGGRFACFMLDGKCAWTTDSGKTWTPMKEMGRNWDYAAVDWSTDTVTNIFAEQHEVGGKAYLSNDGGTSWKLLFEDKEFDQTGGLGIFDAKTLVRTKAKLGIERSTDAGATWAKVSDFQPIGRVARVYKGTAYWLSKDGVLISTDQGATWTKRGDACPGTFGPLLDPADEKRMVVAGTTGIYKSTNGGATWTIAAPLAPKFDLGKPGWFTNVAWDPKNDILYSSRMGFPAYRWEPTPK
jgi:hypothetical protein